MQAEELYCLRITVGAMLQKTHSITHYNSVKNIASKITQLKINHPAIITKVTLQ